MVCSTLCALTSSDTSRCRLGHRNKAQCCHGPKEKSRHHCIIMSQLAPGLVFCWGGDTFGEASCPSCPISMPHWKAGEKRRKGLATPDMIIYESRPALGSGFGCCARSIANHFCSLLRRNIIAATSCTRSLPGGEWCAWLSHGQAFSQSTGSAPLASTMQCHAPHQIKRAPAPAKAPVALRVECNAPESRSCMQVPITSRRTNRKTLAG